MQTKPCPKIGVFRREKKELEGSGNRFGGGAREVVKSRVQGVLAKNLPFSENCQR